MASKSELEKELHEARMRRLKHADAQIKWAVERANLMRVIFQLSAALEHARSH